MTNADTSLRPRVWKLLFAVGLPLFLALPPLCHAADSDPVVLRFSSVGDSRLNPDEIDPSMAPVSGQDRLWQQNSRALSRILRSIQAQQAQLLLFNGDMINGYGKAVVPTDLSSVKAVVASDLVQTYTQYAYWRGMVASIMEAGTYVVPVAGNHETQWRIAGKLAQPENENAWRANMGDLILDAPRMQSITGEAPSHIDTADHAALDALPSDQSQLSYSFDLKGTHFAIINTDPTGNDSHAPTAWLRADLDAARARGLKRLFVFGHKPAFTYYFNKDAAHPLPADPSGLANDTAARDAFWQVIESRGATYFCGHQHIYNLSQHGSAWQVMVGSGGSPFDAKPGVQTLSATDRYYAWVTVSVHASGKTVLEAWGFDDHFGPLRKLRTLRLDKPG
jgi:hypothetical protein